MSPRARAILLVVSGGGLTVLALFSLYRGDDQYVQSFGQLLFGLGFILYAREISRGVGHWSRLVVLVISLTGVGFALQMIDLTSDVSSRLREVNLPLLPDVEVSVVSTATLNKLGGREPPPGHVYLLVTARVESTWAARGTEMNPSYFSLVAHDRVYDTATITYGLNDHCDFDQVVPVNGTVSCPIVFEVPTSVRSGTLQFDAVYYFDSTRVTL